jgi:hypothetical protein
MDGKSPVFIFSMHIALQARFQQSKQHSPLQTDSSFDPSSVLLSALRDCKKVVASSADWDDVDDTPLERVNKATPFVGESTLLEKPYLRLTTYPRKEDVRPLPILEKALVHIKNRYVQTEDFDWCNEQLKSVRQDATVQQIRNAFVVDVYETHARMLLEHGDLNEFNQCQSMIKGIVDQYGIQQQSEQSAKEFRAYAILYALVRESSLQLNQELKRMFNIKESANTNNTHGGSRKRKKRRRVHHHHCDSDDAGDSISISPEDHAWRVVQAVIHCDYSSFFRLYQSAPHMSPYLMDFLVHRVRNGAYERILASFRPSISVEHLCTCLHFDDLEETRRFLKHRKAVFVQEESTSEPPCLIDCRDSWQQQSTLSR